MRYSDDVVNAENWNTGLKKSARPSNPEPGEIAGQGTAIINVHKINSSTVSTRSSGRRMRKRKKRGMFFLSGLLTGLFSRPLNRK